LIQSGIYDRLLAKMVERYQGLKVGEASKDLDVGPLISKRQKDIVKIFRSD